MKKLMLAFLAFMMLLGSLRAFADETAGSQSARQGDAAILLVLGALKTMAQQGQHSIQFDIYTHKDDKQDYKIVLLPTAMAREILAIDRSNASDAEKVAKVAQLFQNLAADKSEDSYCAVVSRVFSEKIQDEGEKAKEMERILERCHTKLTKERIVKKADKLFTKEELNNLQLPANVSEFQRYRIAYSFGMFLLTL